MTSLSQVFEKKFDGKGDGRGDPRSIFLNRIEEELSEYIPGNQGLEKRGQRAALTSKGLYRLYVAVLRCRGKEPGFLYNGRSVMEREEFDRLRLREDTDTESLDKIWKNICEDDNQ